MASYANQREVGLQAGIEEVDHAFDSGLRAKWWGYNGRVNSTAIDLLFGFGGFKGRR